MTDLHHQFRLKPYSKFGLPHFWGVSDLKINESALLNRRFEVESGTFLFSDGSYLEFPGNAIIKPRLFDEEWMEGDKPLTIYLGLKKLGQIDRNVSMVKSLAEESEIHTRFVSTIEPEEVNDIFHDGPSGQVSSLYYVARIFFQTEQDRLDDYDIIPIAILERDGDSIILSRRFIPPCVNITASPILSGIIKEIRDEIAGRIRNLEEYKSPSEMQKAELDSSHMLYILALNSLNSFAPLLTHVTEPVSVHPWDVYGVIRQLIGELSTFTERMNVFGESSDGIGAGIPAYDHSDLYKCFSVAHNLIGHLLNEITVGVDEMVRLEKDGDIFSADLPDNFLDPKNRFYLVLRTETDLDELLRSVQSVAKMGARKILQDLVSRALSGIELLHLQVPPQGMPRRSAALYFRVEEMGEQWDLVEKSRNVAFFLDNAPEDLKAELVARRR